MSDLNAFADFLDFNFCRRVKSRTGVYYYVVHTLAPVLLEGKKSAASNSLPSQVLKKISSRHVHRTLLSTANGVDQRMVLVTVEGIVEFLQNTETTRAKMLSAKWKAGTLMDLPRFVEDKPWYKLRVKSKPIFDTYTDDQPSAETETSADSETNENSSTALVPVTRMVIGDEETFVCDARLLWEKLGVKNHFRSWITRRIEEYNFVENTDFVKVFSNAQNCAGENKGGKPKIDYILTLDVSKELAMVERNDMGRKIRKYFIEVQRDWVPSKISNRFTEDYQTVKAEYLEEQETSSCTDLVVVKDGVVLADSLGVAERFEKNHYDVVKKVRQIVRNNPKQAAGNFTGGCYSDQNGQKRPMYTMTRDGFSFLVMGFTGRKADEWKWKYIDAFNAMEAELRKPKPSDSQAQASINDTMVLKMFEMLMEDRKDNRKFQLSMLEAFKSLKNSDYSIIKPPYYLEE